MLKVSLIDGLKIGEATYTKVHLFPLTAGEAMDAVEAAESIRMSENGEPVFQHSTTRASAERIRRQLKRLVSDDGEIQGPVTLKDIRAMSEGDYRKLTAASDKLDALILKQETGDGGRDESPASDGDSGTPEA